MSWQVQNLLKNKVAIKTKADMASDEFNDLLVVEKQVESLSALGLLSDFDKRIIELVGDGTPYSDLNKVLDLDRTTISKLFSQVCERIAYYLGGDFTDEGLIEELTEKYQLTDEQIEKLKNYVSSNHKHRLTRKTHAKN